MQYLLFIHIYNLLIIIYFKNPYSTTADNSNSIPFENNFCCFGGNRSNTFGKTTIQIRYYSALDKKG